MPSELYQRDAAALSRLQHLRFFPLAIAKGRGNELIEPDGRALLDLSATWGAASLGYGHPAIREAVANALEAPAGAGILSAASAPAVDLAERLLEITPGPAERRVWLGHSGSDANETVARAVLEATGRPRILAFHGAYHGGTAGSMAVSGHTSQEGVAKASGLTLFPYPNPYRPFEGDPTGGALLEHIETILAGECPGEEAAAFFFEPVQADGGVIVPPKNFFLRLQEICRRHGILTVCDEVKVGLARSGKLHCCEHDGLVPDIMVFGKGLGGGLPISAAVGPVSVLDFRAAFSFQTLQGNAASTAAALAVLEVIRREDLATNARQTGLALQSTLTRHCASLDVVGEIRGRGLALGIELVENSATQVPAPRLAALAAYRAYELGAVLYYVGMDANVLELTPPLTLTVQEAERGAEIVATAIRDAAEGRVPENRLDGFGGW